MKAVLLSVRPELCELIVMGKKTLDVRKTAPKLKPPFKCYIYVTKEKTEKNYRCKSGKIIGEFICDNIDWVGIPYPVYQSELPLKYIEQSCVFYKELHRYAGHNNLAFWRITKLKTYEKPMVLNNFKKYNRTCTYSDLGFFIPNCDECKECNVTKAPQSWLYVEEI